MSVTGESDGQPGGGPQKVGVAHVDVMTGLYAVIAILGAIHHRQQSGVGQYIDLALFDVQVATLANQGMNFLTSGIVPKRLGNAHPNIVPYEAVKTKNLDAIALRYYNMSTSCFDCHQHIRQASYSF